MFGADFRVQAQKLREARRALMAPQPRGEADSFAAAFKHCDLALQDLDMAGILEDEPRSWVETIRQALDTTSLRDSAEQARWEVRAAQLSSDERIAFCTAVDELASWFEARVAKSRGRTCD